MKRRKHLKNQSAPKAPGWYRVVSQSLEELRYFDGKNWTEWRRGLPFWMEGPEWSDVIRPGAYIDSDDPRHVTRNLSLSGSRLLRRKLASRPQMRPTKKVAWFLLGLMVVVTASSYVTSSLGPGRGGSAGPTTVALISSSALTESINSTCIGSELRTLKPLGTLESTTRRITAAAKLGLARAYATTLGQLDLAMHEISAPPGDQESLASWQTLWDSAASEAAALSQQLAKGNRSVASTTKVLSASLLRIDQFAAANSINSCTIFVA